MDITLYNNKQDPNTLNKTPTELTAVTGRPIEPLDITRPEVVLNADNIIISGSTLAKANYCYIPDFDRYYYITELTFESGNRVILHCRVDVLNSFAADIRQLYGTIDRQENVYNGYLVDSNYNALAYKQITTKTFPNGMTDDTFILITTG